MSSRTERSPDIEAAVSPASLTVSEVREPAQLEALAPEWDLLLDDAEGDGLFRSPGWLLPWCATLLPEGATIRVLVVRRADAGALVGLLPLWEEPGRGVRRWRLLGCTLVGSDHLGLIARRGDETSCAAAVAQALAGAARDGRLDVLELEDLCRENPANRALREALASAGTGRGTVGGMHRVEREASACPFVPRQELAPFPGAHFERCDASLAAQLRRKRAWLERRPGYRYRRCTGDEALVGLEEWIRLHQWRWRLEGGSAALVEPAVLEFHRQAGRRLAPLGRLRLNLLEVDGRAVAAVYALERGARAYFYQTGYDPDWTRRSVGAVLLSLVMEDCHARGLQELDLLRGSEPYKFRLGSGCRRTEHLRLGLSWSGQLWLRASEGSRATRQWVKERLPPSVREPLASWSRRLRGLTSGLEASSA